MRDDNKNNQQPSTSQSDSLPFTAANYEQDDKVDNAGKLQHSETDAAPIKNTKSIPAVAEVSSGKYDPFYNMNHKYRGKAHIFNHETFDLALPPRTGTHIDRDNLTIVLEHLGFDVIPHEDRTYAQIKDIIRDIVSIDHDESDCVLIAVMTHGEYGLLYAKDTHYPPEALWSPFTADKCPSLAGKPKIFIIQACQGEKCDSGIMLVKKHETQMDGSTGRRENTYRIPVHADFVIARSTIPGFYSWREPGYGSWFIQTLCQELHDYGKEQDLLRLLTFVNQKVAMFETYNPSDLSRHRQKQIPSVNSMLTRLLVFGTKTHPDDSDSGEVKKHKILNIKLKPSLLSSCFSASE